MNVFLGFVVFLSGPPETQNGAEAKFYLNIIFRGSVYLFMFRQALSYNRNYIPPKTDVVRAYFNHERGTATIAYYAH